MSFVLVLMAVALLIIISFTLVALNTLNLNLVAKNRDSVKAYWASQAGISDALAQLKISLMWSSGFTNKALPNNNGNYTVTFTAGLTPYSTNNSSGATTVTGWNGTSVPAGYIHIVSIGSFGKSVKYSQIIAEGSGSSFFWYPYLAQEKIVVNRGFTSDSFDSSAGTYAATHTNSGASIRSNSIQNNTLNVNATSGAPTNIYGDLIIGPGGDVNTAITTSSYVTVSGSKAPAPSLYNFPQITETGNSNNLDISGNQSLPAGIYGSVAIRNNATLTLTGTQYTFKTTTFGNNAQLIIPAGSDPVTIYLDGNMDASGGLIVNNTQKSTHLLFFASDSCSTIKLSNDSYLAIYARGATFFPSGSLANIYGGVAVKQINGKDNLSMHFDKALKNIAVPGYAGGSLVIKSHWTQ